jgi:acetyltransferase-like isoleucine patch superfamily enzyme
MQVQEAIQRMWRKWDLLPGPLSLLRHLYYSLRGARIGHGTRLPRVQMVWPHQVSIGARCILQNDIFFNFDHYWVPGPSIILGDRCFVGRGCEFNIREKLVIGADCLIASGCTFVDHDHGMSLDTAMNAQPCMSQPIIIENNVWIGAGCIILKGTKVGQNAVIGAGSLLNKSVPPGEVWAGVPAKFIKRL